MRDSREPLAQMGPPILKIIRTIYANRRVCHDVVIKFLTSCIDPAAVHCRFRFHTHCVQWACDMGAWDRRHSGSCRGSRHAISSSNCNLQHLGRLFEMFVAELVLLLVTVFSLYSKHQNKCRFALPKVPRIVSPLGHIGLSTRMYKLRAMCN
jgi:hypothetical protein